MHPTHDQADYAAFRIGEAHFRDAPTEFFLFPPAHEKDQVQLREAVKSLRSFLKAYAKSTYRQDAEKLLAQAEGMLAEHEWYVAQFYAKRGKWAGAAGRLEGLAREYPGFGRAPEVLLSLATAYLEMGERFRAQQTLQQLIVRHPQDERRAQAERLLAEIR
jgi:outer membrane protein assembly factor BamD